MTDAVMQDAGVTASDKPSLKDLAKDFITMTLIIRRGREVKSVDEFVASVDSFFSQLEQEGRRANYSVEQIKDAQYALCAFLDESVLRTNDSELRPVIELNPMQFRYFGVHLAGEGFFERIDALRGDVKSNLDVLEVFHLCLALGFEGKFSLGQKDQLRYLANTLGQDIARYRKMPKALSPDWALPDQVSQMFRHEIPVWLYVALIALVCAGVYLTLNWFLSRDVAALSEHISQLFGA